MTAHAYNYCCNVLGDLDDILRPLAKASPEPKHREMYQEAWNIMHGLIEQFFRDDSEGGE